MIFLPSNVYRLANIRKSTFRSEEIKLANSPEKCYTIRIICKRPYFNRMAEEAPVKEHREEYKHTGY